MAGDHLDRHWVAFGVAIRWVGELEASLGPLWNFPKWGFARHRLERLQGRNWLVQRVRRGWKRQWPLFRDVKSFSQDRGFVPSKRLHPNKQTWTPQGVGGRRQQRNLQIRDRVME